MKDDPWAGIATPSATAVVSGRRVAAENRWDFFWAKDHTGRCLLLLQHDETSTPAERLPVARGLTVEVWDAGPGRQSLVLRLIETSQRDIFLKLATDIIAAAEDVHSEAEAVSVALARTWRWHHLLKGGQGGKLGDEEQKGLIGGAARSETPPAACTFARSRRRLLGGATRRPQGFRGRPALDRSESAAWIGHPVCQDIVRAPAG